MDKKDLILAVICGLSVAWIANDFLNKYGWVFFVVLPALAVAGLLLCDIMGKRYLFIRQAGKFVLAGAFTGVIDIRVFQLLFLVIPIPLLLKAVSFIIATLVKYYSDKHWTFEKHENEGVNREIAYFFLVAVAGLAINVVSFYFFSMIRVGISLKLWTELSIILAALTSATWNFCGYKFIVFKK